MEASIQQRNIREWIIAARPWSLPASIMSVMVTAAFILFSGKLEVSPFIAILLILSVAMFHTAGNLLSDYNDYINGIDTKDALCVRSLVDGRFSRSEIRIYGLASMAAACLAGSAILIFVQPESILPIVITGVLTAVGTSSYHLMKYRALGEIHIILFFGIMPAIATSLILSGSLDADVILLTLCYFPSIAAILLANNIRDIKTDTQANIKTIAMIAGGKKAYAMYISLLVIQPVSTLLLIAAGILPITSLVTLLSLPLFFKCIRIVRKSVDMPQEANDADKCTAQLQLFYCILLIISLIPII